MNNRLMGWRKWTSAALTVLLLSGCSWQAGSGNRQAATQLPSTTTELIMAEPGPLAGTHFYLDNYPHRPEIYRVLEQLPVLVDGMDEAVLHAYWGKLLSLFAEDYLGPQSVADRWRVASFGAPDVEDARLQFRENFNVEIVLDASSSMAQKIGEKTKMQLAKDAIKEFAASLPEGARVSLRVYGHKGSSADQDKQLSCGSSELVYPLQPYNADSLDRALEQFAPTGWTAIAHSLQLAREDLAAFNAKENTNIIYLVSDGIETCGGEPVKVASELSKSEVMPLLNVIGFDVNAEGQKQLKEIARVSQGLYANVTNQEQFKQELERAQEIAEKWEKWKQDVLTELDLVRIDRTKWITRYDRDWYEKNWRESLNLGAAIQYLGETGKIGKEASRYLSAKRQEREAFVTGAKEELTVYLRTLTEMNDRQLRQEIEEKYTGD